MKGISDKITIYRTLHTLNQGFEIVILACARLESLGCMDEDNLRTCTILAEELRALANSHVVDELQLREERDCTRLQNRRDEWLMQLKVQSENMPYPWPPVPKPERKANASKQPRKSAAKKAVKR